MRKILIVLTLIVSSFFIFNTSVKADTISLNISQTEFNKYFSNRFDLTRTNVMSKAESISKYYILIYNITESRFEGYYFNDYDVNFVINNNILELTSPISYSSMSYWRNASVLYAAKSGELNINLDLSTNPVNYIFLDTNYPNFIYSGYTELSLVYDTCTYTLKNGRRVRGLYDYYIANQNSCILADEPIEDIHAEEKEILQNFYTTIINKIVDLSNNVFSNYILLSVIGIFIFILIFELIFRRYL